MTPLTPRQKAVLDYLRDRSAESIAPSYAEIALHFGTSNPTAWRHVLALQEKGYVTMAAGKMRSIKIVGAALPSQADDGRAITALREIRSKCGSSRPVTTAEIMAICDGALA